MDVVYNHLGPVGNHLAELAPYFTDRHVTHWGDAVNFDGPDAGEVRRFVVDNALHWLRDHHCDGLRLDAVHAIVDDSDPHILAEVGQAVDRLSEELDRRLIVIAESDLNDPVFVRPRPDGHGLDAAWADDWHHALHAVLTGETDGYYADFGHLDDLTKALEQAWVYDGTWSRHRQRPHGGSPDGLPAERFVVAAQNHDQVGNRAAGERLGALTTPGRLGVAAALLLTSPFTVLLFQGEEWGASTPFQYFTDHQDPVLGLAVSEGRAREFAAFGWAPGDVPDPQDPATFERSVLRWQEAEEGDHARLHAWYRDLIALGGKRLTSTTRASGARLVTTAGSWSSTVGPGGCWPTSERTPTVPTSTAGRWWGAWGVVTDDRNGLVLPVDSVAILRTAPTDAPHG